MSQRLSLEGNTQCCVKYLSAVLVWGVADKSSDNECSCIIKAERSKGSWPGFNLLIRHGMENTNHAFLGSTC